MDFDFDFDLNFLVNLGLDDENDTEDADKSSFSPARGIETLFFCRQSLNLKTKEILISIQLIKKNNNT